VTRRRPQHRVEDGMLVRRYAGGEPTLVWLHGLGESGLCFEEIVGVAPLDGMTHVVPDLPGYGRSAWPEEAPSLVGLAEQVGAWLDASVGPSVIVGHSMGGAFGILIAQRLGKLVRALVDVDGNKSLGDCAYSCEAEGVDVSMFERDRFPAMLARILGGVQDRAVRGYYVSLKLCDPRVFYRHALDLAALSRAETLAADLAALPMPKVYIAGVPHGAAPRTHELLREAGVPIVGIEPAGHWPFIDQEIRFAEALAAFVGEAL